MKDEKIVFLYCKMRKKNEVGVYYLFTDIACSGVNASYRQNNKNGLFLKVKTE